ncbi:MAG: AAA family ATPase [Pirellulales bacterium]
MRIDLLYLDDFKNLKNFEVDFDLKSSRQVIVGRNGVGKSNLLEAIGQIFRDLDLEEPHDSPTAFGYRIEYHCNDHFVRITSARQQPDVPKSPFARTYEIAQDGGNAESEKDARTYGTISQAEFYRRNRPLKTETGNEPNPERLLPLYVFGYYSGVSGRFNDVFARHEELYYKQQIKGEEAPLRPLFLAKPHHSQFSLLSFFAANDETAKTFLREEFRIAGLDSVLFALHEPYWNKGRMRSSEDEGDHRFWKTGGKVSPLLDSLFAHAMAPMAGEEKTKISLGQEQNKERRFLYLQSQEALQAVAQGLQPKEFFSRLESAIFSDVVSSEGDDVRIRVKLTDAAVPVLFKELSEGEQQLLTLIGLMRFTAQNESLFLLDEPDTHLNPAWCLDYLSNLRKYGVEPKNSQILVTTHSPLTFAGLEKQEVVILERQKDDRIISYHPTSHPKGMGFAAILTSELFGLRAALDHETLKKIDEKRELAFKEPKTDEDRQKLAALNEELGRLDFTKSVRDPLYLEYVHAMTKAQQEHPEIEEPAPSMPIWEARKKIAEDIAKRLLEQGAKQ